MLKIDGVGQVITRSRELCGLSMGELSRILDWDKSRLSKYENGQLALSTEVIEQIANGLNLRPEVLVLRCMKEKYEGFSTSRAGKLLEHLVVELERT